MEKSGPNFELLAGAAQGSIARCSRALNDGADIHCLDAMGVCVLSLACGALSPEVVRYLLNEQADPHFRDEHLQRTPLHWVALAASTGHASAEALEITRLLVDAGADIFARDRTQKMPAHLAAACPSVELSALLSGVATADGRKSDAPIPANVDNKVPQAFTLAVLAKHITETCAHKAVSFALSAGRPVCIHIRTDWARDYEAALLKSLVDQFSERTGTLCTEIPLKSILSKADPDKRASTYENVRATILEALAAGRSVLMLSLGSVSLDPLVAELVALETSIARFSPASLSALCAKLWKMDTAPDFGELEWPRMAGPLDLIVASHCESARVGELLQIQVERRVASLQPKEPSISLDQLHGLGAAKTWAQNLIADMRAAQAGTISWREVDRGALLEGPPGVGKTTIARAIASDAGVRLVATTAATWQSAGHLSEVLQAMEKDFERAAEMSPCILFVDEIDAIGSRTEDGEGAQHSQWVRWTVNHLLALMDGFSKSRKVVVLGATNHAVKVDPALRRSGRLDRTIRIPLPNRPALVAIYSHYLSAASHNLSAVDVDELGQCSVGMSGADVERFVREGRRRARNRKRPLILPDILESIYATPPEEARIALLPDELESTAWHEAGHAVMMWSGPERAVGLNYISIVPRPDGTLGFMAQSSREGQHSFTRAKLVHELAVLLGGRAAEEIRFGKEGVSSGCISDLRVASNLGMDIVGRLGLGAAGRLATPYGERAHQELADDVEAELQSAYSTALATLSEHQPLLERIATALIDKSEISGAEFKRIATAYQLETARAKGRL